jgi:hypothetical protein
MPACISVLPHMCHKSHQYHPRWFDNDKTVSFMWIINFHSNRRQQENDRNCSRALSQIRRKSSTQGLHIRKDLPLILQTEFQIIYTNVVKWLKEWTKITSQKQFQNTVCLEEDW